MTLSRIHRFGILALGCCMGTLLSCTRADIMHIEDVTGLVRIYPEYAGGHTLPDAEYYFYNTDGQTEYLHYESTDDDGNFEGRLPIGTYRVIATNKGASYVEFTGEEDHETFIVKAASDQGPSRAGNYTMLLQPDSVYSIVVGELTVEENDTIRREPEPTLLTKQLNLVFTMADGLATEVTAMTGVLPGVYPGVYLFTCGEWQREESPGRALNFETVAEDDKRKAHILLFGVRDPEYGGPTGYTNILELNMTMADGTSYTRNLDLTETLSDIIEGNEGIIPVNVSIPVTVTKTSIEVVGVVEWWDEQGESEKDLDI